MKKAVSVFVIEIIMAIIMFSILLFMNIIGLKSDIMSQMIPFVVLGLGSIICIKLIDKKDIKELGLSINKNTLFMSIVLSILAVIPLLYSMLFKGEMTIEAEFNISSIIYYFIVGFTEELFFRGYIKVRMQGTNTVLWVIISAIAFTTLHLISSEVTPEMLIFVLIMGIAFALAYKNIKSLIPVIAFHVIWDICADYSIYYDMTESIIICTLIVLFSLIFNKVEERKSIERTIS